MAAGAKNIPHGFWGLVAMFLLVFALALLLLSDELVLFLIFDKMGGVQVDFSLRLTVAFVLMILNMVLAIFAFGVLKKKPETGAEGMIGMKGVVRRVTSAEMWVKVRGELWRAQCAQAVAANEEVLVVGMEGLTLRVEKIATI